MSKVQFTYKTGRQRMLRARDAELLRKLGQGTYMTRDMVAHPVADAVTQVVPVAAPVADIDSMDKEELHALAKERGVKVHHMAGADKVRAALREAQE